MNKREQITTRLATPISKGDNIKVTILYKKISSVKVGRKYVSKETDVERTLSGRVTKIYDHPVYGKLYEITSQESIPYEARLPYEDLLSSGLDANYTVKYEWVMQDTSDCGVDPFKPSVEINFISSDVEGLLFKGSYGKRSDNYGNQDIKIIEGNNEGNKELIGKTYGGINFNPYVYDAEGNKIYFQRDLVWTQEQKQLLIHSIYNGIEIGKFIFKYNSWPNIVKQIGEYGHGYDFECIDGKQRFNAIVEFIQNKFPDEFGNYWDDLSLIAQRKFLRYRNLAIGQLDEKSSDKDIISTFLTINFTGTPMSKEHIEYVQSIKF